MSYTVTHRLCHTLSPTAGVTHTRTHTHASTHARLHARTHAHTHTHTHTPTHTHPSLSLTSPLGAECRLVQPGIGLCMQCFAPTARQLVGFMRQSTRQSNPNRWSPWLIASAHPGICPPNTQVGSVLAVLHLLLIEVNVIGARPFSDYCWNVISTRPFSVYCRNVISTRPFSDYCRNVNAEHGV